PNIAHHALYITGQRFYPGFELVQLGAPALAILRVVDATGDRSVLSEPALKEYWTLHMSVASSCRDQKSGLFTTFLLPTDDPTEYPYTLTANALLAVAFRIAAELSSDADIRAQADRSAQALRAALPEHFS